MKLDNILLNGKPVNITSDLDVYAIDYDSLEARAQGEAGLTCSKCGRMVYIKRVNLNFIAAHMPINKAA